MAELWVYRKHEAIEDYTDWQDGFMDDGYDLYSPQDTVSGRDKEPFWNGDHFWSLGGDYYSGAVVDAPSPLYSDPSNDDTYCEYTRYDFMEEVDEFLNPSGFWIVNRTIFYYERDYIGLYKGDFIEEVIAEYGTYPNDGEQGGYWYVAVGPAWIAPNLKMNINGALKSYKDGWVKVDGALKRINKMWAKINGVLREI